MTASGATPTLRALLARLVDYAGLFPPAALEMAQAVANYAAYLESPDAWMLGRFVVSAARLDELAAEALRYSGSRPDPWRLAVLGGADLDLDARRIAAFNTTHAGRLLADVVEVRAASPEAVAHAIRSAPPGLVTYVEIPIAEEPLALVQAVKEGGARVKVRTGGVAPDTFPSAGQLARVLARCASAGVPFKATAGLHHPIRAEHRLTYAADAPRGMMFGFLNLFAAAAFARAGIGERTLSDLLDERDPAALRFTADALRWRDHLVAYDELVEARASLATAFGSCSFREPVDDLHLLGLL